MNTPISIGEFQYKLIYSIIVAGKSAKFTDAVMDRLMRHFQPYGDPFAACFQLDQKGLLLQRLHDCRTGNYGKLYKALCQLFMRKIDLATVEPEELEAVHGIGPKTSRFFIIWTRPEAHFAALDVHVLRWLRSVGHSLAPKATPNGSKYAYWEQIFLEECRIRGKTARELDHEIWLAGSNYEGIVQATTT